MQFNTSEHHGSFDNRTTPCSNDNRGKEGISSKGGGTHQNGKDDEAISPLKRPRCMRKKIEDDKLGKAGKELFPSQTKGEGKKRKQTKNARPLFDNKDVLMDKGTHHDAMALIVAKVAGRPPTEEEAPQAEIVLEEHRDKNAKKMKKELLTNPMISAVAGNQPGHEP